MLIAVFITEMVILHKYVYLLLLLFFRSTVNCIKDISHCKTSLIKETIAIARLVGQHRKAILLPNISVGQNSPSSGAEKEARLIEHG